MAVDYFWTEKRLQPHFLYIFSNLQNVTTSSIHYKGQGREVFFFAWKLNPQSGIFIFSVQTQLRLRWNSKAYVEKIRKKMQFRDIVSGRFIWNFLSSKKHVIFSALEIRFHAISHLLFLPDYCAKRRSG